MKESNLAMNLCFSTLGCVDYSLEKILSLCRQYGIGNVEIRGIGGELNFEKMPEFSDGEICKTAEKFRSFSVTPLVLGTSCAFHDREKKLEAVEQGIKAVRYAHAIGAGAVRVFGNRLTDDPKAATANVIDGIGEIIARTDRATDVSVLLEVHGDFNTVERLSPILYALQGENRFGLIWDVEHTHESYGENFSAFYGAVAPFLRHVHIKDSKDGVLTLPGEGDLPLLPIVRTLLSGGYTGAFSLEWEKKWHPELPPIEPALEAFLSLMKQV